MFAGEESMRKYRLLSALILAGCLTGSTVHAQQAGNQPLFQPPAPLGQHADGQAQTPSDTYGTSPSGLSDWLLDQRPCCEGTPGKRFPLYTEWYVNSGVSVPVSRATSELARQMETGWSITGGARVLFFNEPLTSAWVIDLHVMNTNEGAGHTKDAFPLTIFQGGTKTTFGSGGTPLATLQDSNRTWVGLGLGHVWYLWGSAGSEGCHWRVGADLGVRYGTHRIDLDQFGDVTDTILTTYVAASMDLEWPCKNVVIFTGARIEWAYTGSDILQTRNSDLQDLNLLFVVGFRY
jgi:hypothetical protein